VGAALVGVKGVPDGFDSKLVHHILVVLLCCERYRLLRESSCA
jgi:hypothetical protein